MFKNIALILAGFILGTVISTASAALFESGTKDAQPKVGYGKNAGVIYALRVDADGVLQTN